MNIPRGTYLSLGLKKDQQNECGNTKLANNKNDLLYWKIVGALNDIFWNDQQTLTELSFSPDFGEKLNNVHLNTGQSSEFWSYFYSLLKNYHV